MIVLSIDKCNADIRSAAELLGRIQTGKTSSYNDDVFHFYDTALFLVYIGTRFCNSISDFIKTSPQPRRRKAS